MWLLVHLSQLGMEVPRKFISVPVQSESGERGLLHRLTELDRVLQVLRHHVAHTNAPGTMLPSRNAIASDAGAIYHVAGAGVFMPAK